MPACSHLRLDLCLMPVIHSLVRFYREPAFIHKSYHWGRNSDCSDRFCCLGCFRIDTNETGWKSIWTTSQHGTTILVYFDTFHDVRFRLVQEQILYHLSCFAFRPFGSGAGSMSTCVRTWLHEHVCMGRFYEYMLMESVP